MSDNQLLLLLDSSSKSKFQHLSEHFKLAEANGYNLTCGFVMPLPENRVIFNTSEHFDIAEEEPSSKFPKTIVLFTLFGLTLLVICLILIKCL